MNYSVRTAIFEKLIINKERVGMVIWIKRRNGSLCHHFKNPDRTTFSLLREKYLSFFWSIPLITDTYPKVIHCFILTMKEGFLKFIEDHINQKFWNWKLSHSRVPDYTSFMLGFAVLKPTTCWLLPACRLGWGTKPNIENRYKEIVDSNIWWSRKKFQNRHAGLDPASITYWNHWIPAKPSSVMTFVEMTKTGCFWLFTSLS